MTTALATARESAPSLDPKVIESVLLKGDLTQLTTEQRLSYYNRICEMLGLNPLTQPFRYLTLNGRLVLYALKDATDQLRFMHNISIDIKAREVIEGIYVVTAGASMPSGRRDESTGAVAIDTLKGETRANAMLKAETKAKRRVTLSICGLGMLDETEVETIRQEPTYTVEAPRRVELPAGTVQILKVTPKSKGPAQWADVEYVDPQGETHTIQTPADGRGAAPGLLEQLAQDAVPVLLTTRVTPRSKKTVIDEVHRWVSPDEHKALDAEIASQDAQSAEEMPL